MILNKVNTPKDLKSLAIPELEQLCVELREFMQQQTKTKEGHIKSSLGVTELTVSIHYVFNTPDDILIWDVGHQAYIHKILTDRKDKFHTNREKGGISGFTSASESEYDPFGAGHSSTSISAAVGFAMADKLDGVSRSIIAVIGDGAITGGMSFEALNYLGEQQLDVLVILNDNQSSIDKNVGALAANEGYPDYCKALNIDYLGECDGHHLEDLITNLNAAKKQNRPRLLKVNTQKGRGFIPAEVKKSEKPAFQEMFEETMMDLAEQNTNLVAITPAMLSGSGLKKFAEKYPDRCFDVGIAEQHAVTMAAGMAAAGKRPVVHLYSTFAQRAYDQIIHDVALQNLPVVFCLDRAGLVGQDGGTHHGAFDPSFCNALPNVTFAAPMDGPSLRNLLNMAVVGSGPWMIRYPKDSYSDPGFETLKHVGQVRELVRGDDKAVLSFGAIGVEVLKAIEGLGISHYDVPFLKPFNEQVLSEIAANHNEIYTVEENSARGGLGDTVRAVASDLGLDITVRSLALPDRFVEHATRAELLSVLGMNSEGIRNFLLAP